MGRALQDCPLSTFMKTERFDDPRIAKFFEAFVEYEGCACLVLE